MKLIGVRDSQQISNVEIRILLLVAEVLIIGEFIVKF